MAKYKIHVSIDEKKFFWIIVENGKIINKNPTKEELDEAKVKYYNRTNVCYICRKEGKITDKSILYPYNACREKDKDRKEIGEWICYNHYKRDWQMRDPNNTGVNTGRYTKRQILESFIRFEIEHGKPPTARDFANHPEYPDPGTVRRYFGSFEKAKKLVGQDLDSMVRKGIIETTGQKARLAEIFVLEHFADKGAIDISGENRMSFIDGICPKEQIYDVKSSKLYEEEFWSYTLDKYVDFYYLLAFNEDWTKLLHAWRIPGDFIDGPTLYISLYGHHIGVHNVENMGKYEITDKFITAFNSWIQKIKENK